MKSQDNDDMIPAGDGIMPGDGNFASPGKWPGTTGSKGPGNDAMIPAGDGIMPCDRDPFGIKQR
jgi:hypothetical protein